MKAIHKFNHIVIIAASLFLASTAAAQEFKSNVSISQQLKEGNVQGMKYGTPAVQKQEAGSAKPKEYTQGNYKDILFTGSTPKSGQTSKSLNKASLGRKASSPIPSDARVQEAEKKKTEGTKLPPMQTQEKGNN